MLKRFLYVYAAVFCIFTVQAEDKQTIDSNSASEVILSEEEIRVESTEKNLLVIREQRNISPGALACDCNEENCKDPNAIIEENLNCDENCEEHHHAGLIACSKCE